MLTGCKFNPVDFTGVDLSKCYFYDIDLSEASGLTAAQLSSMDNFTECKLPSIYLSAADFTGKALWGVDFSKCTGLTGSQLASASDITYIYLTQAQYDAMKADLPSRKLVYVDGVMTRIP